MSFKNGMRPVHPGEVLREEFLEPLGMSVNALAKELHVPTPRINDVVREKRGISADTALRLARYFGGDAQSWLNLQAMYELRVAEIESIKKINREVKARAKELTDPVHSSLPVARMFTTMRGVESKI
jgi:antitoxin HigA-1